MAYEERKHGRPSTSARNNGGGRTGLYIAAAVAFTLIGGGIAYVAFSNEPVEGDLVESPVEDTRPVGAGTFPDGEADEYNEGLGNETTQQDFIEPEAPTDGFANPLLDVPEDDTPTVPSIDQLDPGGAVDEEVLERMAPDGSDADPEAGTGDGTDEGTGTGQTADDL